jgi:hypothetical protein
MTASPARRVHHIGATGNTLVTPYALGTMTNLGAIIQVRSKKKYARQYLVAVPGSDNALWMRHDEIVPAGGGA